MGKDSPALPLIILLAFVLASVLGCSAPNPAPLTGTDNKTAAQPEQEKYAGILAVDDMLGKVKIEEVKSQILSGGYQIAGTEYYASEIKDITETFNKLVSAQPINMVYVITFSSDRASIEIQLSSLKYPGEIKYIEISKPRTGKILLTVWNSRDKTAGVVTMDEDGNNVVNLTKDQHGRDPSFQSDGKQIAFVSNRDRGWYGENDIFLMNSDGSNVRQITSNASHAGPTYQFPAISPDGTKIASCKSRVVAAAGYYVYRYNIVVMNSDGSGDKQLTNVPDTDTALLPKWFPDGQRVAYLYTDASFYRIGFSNLQGEFLGDAPMRIMLPFSKTDLTWFDIAPDGQKIAYSADTTREAYNQYREIFVVDLKSGEISQLTSNELDDDMPCWSPDGKKILFLRCSASAISSTCTLCSMDADGGNQTQMKGSGTPHGWK